MNIISKLNANDKPTEEQLERIEEASTFSYVCDSDSPVYSYEQLAHLYSESKRLNKKQTVGIRLSQNTIDQYKSLGKGYTGIMAAVLDYAINNPAILKEAL